MSDLTPWQGAGTLPTAPRTAAAPQPANLADLLERVLDKGIVIAGDIRINLLDIELLTIKIRLLIASVDRAREMGIDWWEHDPTLSSGHRDLEVENRQLRERLGELEAARSESADDGAPTPRPARRTSSRPGRQDEEKPTARRSTARHPTARHGGTPP
ncbi:gas vesicle protein [Streptomyces tateyamensis]|uniref:Gas vesicle protein n=1 Tax=Streptomyces tateyamensis TaxID=565073 RepID=A0A2V4P239_9ACTN|nr:gas vesicle protein [Streptomyces tateyamensis]PYC87601.1 gas vesicle protein [Streptomyces tateyamensis]